MDNASQEKIGILLSNTGSPASPDPDDVRAYLSKFLSDPRIRPMNMVAWWLILHLFIFPKRGTTSGAKYAKIWTEAGSPFDVEHKKLAELLEATYKGERRDIEVRLGMSYGAPFVIDGLQSLRDAGCTRVVALPLYPQGAFSTSKAVADGVARAMRKLHWDAPVEVIDDYSDDACYLDAVTQTVRESDFNPTSGDKLLFNYHSIPMADIEAGDTYPEAVQKTSVAIASSLGLADDAWAIGFNCQFDKGREWLKPFSREHLRAWAHDSSTGRVFMVCPNFATDCLETLYDIDYELKPFYAEQLTDAGANAQGREFVYIPCLNGTAAHADVLRSVLSRHVE